MHISGLQVLFQSIMNGNSLINLAGLKKNKVQSIFTMEKQEEDYINCESELSEEEYI